MTGRISIPAPSALLEALRLVGPNHGHVEVWERARRELDALVEAVEAAQEVYKYRGPTLDGVVTHVSAERLMKMHAALARFDFGERP